MMNRCYLCRSQAVRSLLEFKRQPVCNRFLTDPLAAQYRHDLVAGQCGGCGLLQLLNPVPAKELMSPYEWITYSEPEGHLDKLADILAALPGLTPQSVIAGISFKDDSILRRLRERGFTNSWRVSPEVDAGIVEKRAGIETLQDRLTPEQAEIILRHHPPADLLIMRHVWEHALQPRRTITAVRQLLNLSRSPPATLARSDCGLGQRDPGGYLVLESPDCSRALANGDYTTLWEEHQMYFTPVTFRAGLSWVGLELLRLECFPYPFENSLVAIARFPPVETECERGQVPELPALAAELERAGAFAQAFPGARARIRNLLTAHRAQGGRIAVFGAGHLACAFINFLELKELVECVVDDHPRKKGLFMPGSALPICGSEELLKRRITLCLLSLSPESEDKVIERQQAFIQQGGRFASIFPASKHALR
ncbi:MAG: SAM-dependent methyltransferase [Lentisphaerae bacterium]|nr:SAM-dependent methyltransferase [Lentisphaerota bacterium]